MKNWEKLEADVNKILTKHFSKGRSGAKVNKVIVHYNAGNLTVEGCYNVWQTRQASAHYQVEDDGRIGQLVWDSNTAWHAGNWNANISSIGIEHANNSDGTITEACLDNGAHLVAAVCKYYRLGRPQWLKNVFPHKYFANTSCPGQIYGSQKDAYIKRAQKWYDEMTGASSGTSGSTEESGSTVAEKSPLNGIDISHWQNGIDLGRISYDFMICKATEGTTYVDKNCNSFIQKAKNMGKLWGFYHFMDTKDPVKQADFFVDNCANYFGEGIPVLDYESYGRIGTAGAKKFLDRVYERTKVRCFVYMSRSVCTEEDWSKIAPNHPLWMAQYANNNTTGYQSNPWHSGSTGAWDTFLIHQYSSHGRLNGYNGNLDLDIAYMTPSAWKKYAAGEGGSVTPAPTPSEETSDLGDMKWWGKKFTKELQKQLGTEQDGIVSRQPKSNKKYIPCADTSSWSFVSSYKNGSAMVKALQKKVGTTADGWFGTNTAKALQKYLQNNGFSVGSSGIDGYFGHDSCNALGQALKAKLFQ